MIKKFLYVFFFIIFLQYPVYATEVIESFDEKNLSVLNDVLDSSGRDIRGLNNYYNSLLDELTGFLSHTHDGDSSEQISYSDILNVPLSDSDAPDDYPNGVLLIDGVIGTTSDFPASAGNVLYASMDTERTYIQNPPTWTKVKSYKLLKPGTYRIKFDLKISASGYAYGKIYRNGVAVGTEQSETSTSYVTKSEDISGWSVGDEIQLYINTSNAGLTAYTQNFRLYYQGYTSYGNVYDQSYP